VVKRLHITASLRIVANHRNTPHISIYNARSLIRDLANAKHRTLDDQRLVEDLERATGTPIAELAKLTAQWLPLDKGAASKRGR